MITKSIRLPEELLASIVTVEKAEHIEEDAAIRKLIRIGKGMRALRFAFFLCFAETSLNLTDPVSQLFILPQ